MRFFLVLGMLLWEALCRRVLQYRDDPNRYLTTDGITILLSTQSKGQTVRVYRRKLYLELEGQLYALGVERDEKKVFVRKERLPAYLPKTGPQKRTGKNITLIYGAPRRYLAREPELPNDERIQPYPDDFGESEVPEEAAGMPEVEYESPPSYSEAPVPISSYRSVTHSTEPGEYFPGPRTPVKRQVLARRYAAYAPRSQPRARHRQAVRRRPSVKSHAPRKPAGQEPELESDAFIETDPFDIKIEEEGNSHIHLERTGNGHCMKYANGKFYFEDCNRNAELVAHFVVKTKPELPPSSQQLLSSEQDLLPQQEEHFHRNTYANMNSYGRGRTEEGALMHSDVMNRRSFDDSRRLGLLYREDLPLPGARHGMVVREAREGDGLGILHSRIEAAESRMPFYHSGVSRRNGHPASSWTRHSRHAVLLHGADRYNEETSSEEKKRRRRRRARRREESDDGSETESTAAETTSFHEDPSSETSTYARDPPGTSRRKPKRKRTRHHHYRHRNLRTEPEREEEKHQSPKGNTYYDQIKSKLEALGGMLKSTNNLLVLPEHTAEYNTSYDSKKMMNNVENEIIEELERRRGGGMEHFLSSRQEGIHSRRVAPSDEFEGRYRDILSPTIFSKKKIANLTGSYHSGKKLKFHDINNEIIFPDGKKTTTKHKNYLAPNQDDCLEGQCDDLIWAKRRPRLYPHNDHPEKTSRHPKKGKSRTTRSATSLHAEDSEEESRSEHAPRKSRASATDKKRKTKSQQKIKKAKRSEASSSHSEEEQPEEKGKQKRKRSSAPKNKGKPSEAEKRRKRNEDLLYGPPSQALPALKPAQVPDKKPAVTQTLSFSTTTHDIEHPATLAVPSPLTTTLTNTAVAVTPTPPDQNQGLPVFSTSSFGPLFQAQPHVQLHPQAQPGTFQGLPAGWQTEQTLPAQQEIWAPVSGLQLPGTLAPHIPQQQPAYSLANSGQTAMPQGSGLSMASLLEGHNLPSPIDNITQKLTPHVFSTASFGNGNTAFSNPVTAAEKAGNLHEILGGTAQSPSSMPGINIGSTSPAATDAVQVRQVPSSSTSSGFAASARIPAQASGFFRQGGQEAAAPSSDAAAFDAFANSLSQSLPGISQTSPSFPQSLGTIGENGSETRPGSAASLERSVVHNMASHPGANPASFSSPFLAPAESTGIKSYFPGFASPSLSPEPPKPQINQEPKDLLAESLNLFSLPLVSSTGLIGGKHGKHHKRARAQPRNAGKQGPPSLTPRNLGGNPSILPATEQKKQQPPLPNITVARPSIEKKPASRERQSQKQALASPQEKSRDKGSGRGVSGLPSSPSPSNEYEDLFKSLL